MLGCIVGVFEMVVGSVGILGGCMKLLYVLCGMGGAFVGCIVVCT